MLFTVTPEYVDDFTKALANRGYSVGGFGQTRVVTCNGQETINRFSIVRNQQPIASLGCNHNPASPSHIVYAAPLYTDLYHPELLNEVAGFLDMPSTRSEVVKKPEMLPELHGVLAEVDELLRQLQYTKVT
mgnify:CR=1 FL=1